MDLIGTRCLRDLLEEKVASCPDRELLVYEDRGGTVQRWTYEAFDRRVNQVANGLRREGIERDEKVAVHLANTPELLVTWFALAKLGAVMVPSNTANVGSDLQYLLDFSDATTLVTEPAFLDRFRAVQADCPRVRRVFLARARAAEPGTRLWEELWQGQKTSLAADRFDNETVAELVFTSGTTARPKAALITHANCLWSGERASKHFRLAPEERNFTSLPCFHVNAQSYTVLSTLTVGGTILLMEGFSASKFWSQVRRHRAHVVSLVAPLLRMLLAQPPQPTDRDHTVRLVIFGLNCTEKEREEFQSRFGVPLLKGYGLTEAMTMVSRAPIDGDQRWPSIGLPALDREVKLVGEDGAEVAAGQVGEIAVRGVPGRTLMKAYYKNPEATAEAVRNGWLFTGDTAWMDETGYLYFFERKKEVIKVGGENVSAVEVEQTLAEHPAVVECAVIGVPDPVKDEAVKVFVVARPGARLTAEEVQAFCAGRLAKFKVPSMVEFRDALPKTSIGKIEKKLLRPAAARAAAEGRR
jgi:crotonobetaine/carnitine-CoA ligase